MTIVIEKEINKLRNRIMNYSYIEILQALLYDRDIDIELMNEREKQKLQKGIMPRELKLYCFSIDYDGKSELQKLKMYFNMKYIFQNSIIEIHETIHGWHFLVRNKFVEELGIERSIILRNYLMDDVWRVVCGEGRGGDTLFFTSQVYWEDNEKGIRINKEKKYNTIDEESLLCYPFNSLIHKKYNNKLRKLRNKKKR